jgi:hypothetical protein
MSGKSLSTAVMAALVLVAASVAGASPINYGNFPGILPGQVDFWQVTENSTTDPTPLFGPPTRVGNSLYFFPNSYTSFSQDGSADTTSGTLQMMVTAPQGKFITTVVFSELGDYALTGEGTSATQATVAGLLTVTDLAPGNSGTGTAVFNFVPSFRFQLPDDSTGQFNGGGVVDLSGLDVTAIFINFNNILQTSSEPGTTSFIEKKVIDGMLVTIETPEPATMAMLTIGGIGMLVARRRSRK